MNPDTSAQRLARFDAYLAQDPGNRTLLQEAIDHALAAGDAPRAMAWAERALAEAPQDGSLQHLRALTLLRCGDVQGALQAWQQLAAADSQAATQPGVRYNLAYTLMLAQRHDEAAQWLDDATAAALPAAAALRVRLLHAQQQPEEAMAYGRAQLARGAADPQLSAHLSVVAIDLEDFAAAAELALQGAELPEAQTTLGHVALAQQDLAAAEAAFARALATRSDSARAWLGAGLSALARHDFPTARQRLERSTQLAPGHLGGWIARAWAHIGERDLDGAVHILQQAEAIDRNFAEVQGCLAVTDVLRGDNAAARHRMQAALKLDPQSLSARLAQSMLLEGAGRPEAARALVDQALARPMLGNVTLGSAVQRFKTAGAEKPRT
jgi:tetratricopeptide (TPR) repeat protein